MEEMIVFILLMSFIVALTFVLSGCGQGSPGGSNVPPPMYTIQTPPRPGERRDQKERENDMSENQKLPDGIYYHGNGAVIPIKEITGLEGKGAIIVQMTGIMRKEDMLQFETGLSEKLGVKVVAVDGFVGKVLRLAE